jgi:hypothetical protein
MSQDIVAVWRRVDVPGHEHLRLVARPPIHRLAGTALFLDGERPCCLQYAIVCDATWRTHSLTVSGWMGADAVRLTAEVSSAGMWKFNGMPCEQLAGCVDVDFFFSPATNLLPLRRLGLAVGEAADVDAAWITPQFTLDRLPQRYERIAEQRYRYRSPGCEVDLEVSDDGIVTRYPGQWELAACNVPHGLPAPPSIPLRP